MASLLKVAAHYTNIWGVESPLSHRHNVVAPQSLSPMNYYVIAVVPSQRSSSYAERRILFYAKRAGLRTAISCHHLRLLFLKTRHQVAIIVFLSLFNHRVNKTVPDFYEIWHLLCCVRCHSQNLPIYCSGSQK